MKITEDGHTYQLQQRGSADPQRLMFVNTEKGHEHVGITTQEAVRALIDRTQYCDACLPWSGNHLIVKHLRMVIALHEARALLTGVERGTIPIEQLLLDQQGHLALCFNPAFEAKPYHFDQRPAPATETGSLQPGEACHTKES